MIVLNDQAYEALGKPRAIDILYDEAEPLRMGIRGDSEGDYTPRRAQNAKGWLLSGSSFLRFIGHYPTETQRYRPPPPTEGVLAIDLSDPMPKPNRGPKQRNKGEVAKG